MKTQKLNTKLGSSDIIIGGSMKDLKQFYRPDKTILLVDENVLRNYKDLFSEYQLISIPQGENSKSLEQYSEIFGRMLESGVDRSWKLVGIGGGITTDLSGYVASTYFRGIDYGFVSTTLLGQVDAAIGGKNGINYKGYKNLIGVIRQPEFVVCDLESLKTLPKKEFIAGFAEIVKYGFIRNPEIYSYLKNNIDAALDYHIPCLEKLVYESVKVKIDIVESDVSEKGDRKLLNFGHTFAHAIEKLSKISHGEAVSVGMVMASKLSVSLGLCKENLVAELEEILKMTGLPVSIDLPFDQMIEAMKKDKKKSGDTMSLILIRSMGDAFVHEVKIEKLKSLLDDLR